MTLLDRLRGGLIVSVQAHPGSAINDPLVLAAIAAASVANGAVAVRMQGVANLQAARGRVRAPLIGLIKRDYPGFEPYITPTGDEVRDVLRTGAEIVAVDATLRNRPFGETVADFVATVREAGRFLMADCATIEDARAAAAAGADIVATTLCGYTSGTRGARLPALDLVRQIRKQTEAFVICEGGIADPQQVGSAFDAGADAVVVGTAITNIDVRVREFARYASKQNALEGEK